MKIIVENWWNDAHKQLSLIPRFEIFWSEGTICVSTGWFNLDITVWLGKNGNTY
jgi:hypothetical protein